MTSASELEVYERVRKLKSLDLRINCSFGLSDRHIEEHGLIKKRVRLMLIFTIISIDTGVSGVGTVGLSIYMMIFDVVDLGLHLGLRLFKK